jgi:hypothetical protein
MAGSGKDSAASEKETAPVRPHKLRPSYFGDSCRGATRHGSDCELKFWLSGGLFRGTQRERACRSTPSGGPRDTPIWKLEAALKCRSCKKGRYAPPVHMIKLTATQEITPYKWVHPDEER